MTAPTKEKPMEHTADHTPSRRIMPTSPPSHTASDFVAPGQPSEADRSFIRSMNEFVEKHGTITDDEFFRVL
jgi:hypothetical protein